MSDVDEFSADPVIVFDDLTSQKEETPIAMGFRQPSFTKLQGVPVPKGFKTIHDLQTEKPPVKAEKFNYELNDSIDSMNEFLAKRNSQKWTKMGYDPKEMELCFTRNTSHSHFQSVKTSSLNTKTVFSSFSTLDSIEMISKAPSQNIATLREDDEEDTKKKPKPTSMRRRLSSGTVMHGITELIDEKKAESSITSESNVSSGSQTEGQSMINQRASSRGPLSDEFFMYVVESPESYIYTFMLNQSTDSLTPQQITEIRLRLNHYYSLSIDMNLIKDSFQILEMINSLKTPTAKTDMASGRNIQDSSKKIQELKEEICKVEFKWAHNIACVEQESFATLNSLEDSYREAILELDNEWKSEQKQLLYSKPSSTLLNLQHTFKKLLKAKQLDRIDDISKQIENREQFEINEAQRRMKADYMVALNKLKEQYNYEKASIIANKETKTNHLIRSRDQELGPLQVRLDNLEKQNVVTRKSLLDKPQTTHANQSKIYQPIKLPVFVSSAKLSIPMFNPSKKSELSKTVQITRPSSKKGRNK